MRLTCPNCGAQYEVPDEVIPEEGRDVQCSACDQTWFQAKHPVEPVPEPAPQPEPAPPIAEVATEAPSPKPAADPADETGTEEVDTDQDQVSTQDVAKEDKPSGTGNVDPAVANILQEEAAREADLRAKEGVSLETQTDLALEDAHEPEFEIKQARATEAAEDAGQKDALPDVDAINSTMRSDEIASQAEPAARKSGGFVRGFALMLIIGVILYLIYGNAQQISEAVPQADPVLKSYVSLVDQARIWLETQAGSANPQN
ncbi:MAG: zinc-ribbon domain-containing protein [Pseudomonadota bacterium]